MPELVDQIVPRQLQVWFGMYHAAVRSVGVENLRYFQLLTHARSELELPGALPELHTLMEQDSAGYIKLLLHGCPLPFKLPVACWHCGTRYGYCLGGKLMTHCGIGDCATSWPTTGPRWYDLAPASGYPEHMLESMYLCWLGEQPQHG